MTDLTNVTADIVAECKAAVGRQRVTRDTIAPEPAEKLAILLGAEQPEEWLPPAWHWAYFNRAVRKGDIGRDMHERTGVFLPAAPFNRRMWASGEVTLLQPLRIGLAATRLSTIAAVEFKEGKTGAMCFVTVAHEIDQGGAPCISERQTIVYRDRGEPEKALRMPDHPVPGGYFTHPDHQLFFYSAITHNGHRIHWDRDFCRDVEGYPDLVVHGPMMATELCEAMRDREIRPLAFRYRAQAPVFVTTPVKIVAESTGEERSGHIERSDGVVSMVATLRMLCSASKALTPCRSSLRYRRR